MSHNKANRIICFSLIFILLLSLCSCRNFEIDVHIFSDIEECKNITNLKPDNDVVEIYDSPKGDKYINKLEFQDFFGCKYISDDFSFELFAYEFYSSDIAMSYFQNATGKKNDPNPTFSTVSGIGFYRRIVVSDSMAYTVYCKNSDSEKVVDFLNSWFCVDITGD